MTQRPPPAASGRRSPPKGESDFISRAIPKARQICTDGHSVVVDGVSSLERAAILRAGRLFISGEPMPA